jgi:hypothetical protein
MIQKQWVSCLQVTMGADYLIELSLTDRSNYLSSSERIKYVFLPCY